MSPRPETTRPQFIYVIGHKTGPQKIGFSCNPTGREKMLRRGIGRRLVHYTREVPPADVLTIEALAHWLLHDKSLGLEHFDVSVDDAIAAVENAIVRHARGERAPTKRELNQTKIMSFNFTPRWMVRVNEWRRAQPTNPNISAAIRMLVDLAIDAGLREQDAKAKPD